MTVTSTFRPKQISTMISEKDYNGTYDEDIYADLKKIHTTAAWDSE